MAILDSTEYCEKCLGTGVVLKDCKGMWGQKQMLKCDQCGRFDSDDEAVEAAEQLIRDTYANHRRAHELRNTKGGVTQFTVTCCDDCPMFYDPPNRCGMKDTPVFFSGLFNSSNSVAVGCPLTKTMVQIMCIDNTKAYEEGPNTPEIVVPNVLDAATRKDSVVEPMTNSNDMTEFEIRVAMGSPRSGWTVDDNALGYAKTSWLKQFRKQNKEVK